MATLLATTLCQKVSCKAQLRKAGAEGNKNKVWGDNIKERIGMTEPELRRVLSDRKQW